MARKGKSALRSFDALSSLSSDTAKMSESESGCHFDEDADGRLSDARAARLLGAIDADEAPKEWTVEVVTEWLVEAAHGCERLGGRVGPARMKGFWPDIDAFRNPTPSDKRERELAYIAGTRPPERSTPSIDPRRVARIEEALEWPGRYLSAEEHALNRKALQIWLWCDVRDQKFGATCRHIGLSRRTAYWRRDAALRVILDGVIRDRIRQ